MSEVRVGGIRVYGQHGERHNPRGSDPGHTETWREVRDPGTAWSSGTDYDPGDTIDHGDLYWEAIKASGPGNGGAVEPGVDNAYVAFWWCQASVFINGANMDPTDASPNPVPMQYRLSIGPPNYLETDGSITYTRHQIEILGDLDTALVIPGDVIFIIAPEYRKDHDTPVPTHDISGSYVPCRLLSTGEFIWGVP